MRQLADVAVTLDLKLVPPVEERRGACSVVHCGVEVTNVQLAMLQVDEARVYTAFPVDTPVRHAIYPWIATVIQGQIDSIEGVPTLVYRPLVCPSWIWPR